MTFNFINWNADFIYIDLCVSLTVMRTRRRDLCSIWLLIRHSFLVKITEKILVRW